MVATTCASFDLYLSCIDNLRFLHVEAKKWLRAGNIALYTKSSKNPDAWKHPGLANGSCRNRSLCLKAIKMWKTWLSLCWDDSISRCCRSANPIGRAQLRKLRKLCESAISAVKSTIDSGEVSDALIEIIQSKLPVLLGAPSTVTLPTVIGHW